MIYYDFYKNPGKENDKPERFHPRVINQGSVDLQFLSKEIEKESTLTSADIEASLTAVTEKIRFHLLKGERVQIKGLGYFSVSLKCIKPDFDPKATRAENIKYKALKFKADKEMRIELQNLECKRLTKDLSSTMQGNEIIKKLGKYFKDNKYITRRIMESLCNITPITANRRLNYCIQNNILKNVGTRYNPIYIPGEQFPKE